MIVPGPHNTYATSKTHKKHLTRQVWKTGLLTSKEANSHV